MGHLGIAWFRRLENLTTELSYSSARLDRPRRRKTLSSPINSNGENAVLMKKLAVLDASNITAVIVFGRVIGKAL